MYQLGGFSTGATADIRIPEKGMQAGYTKMLRCYYLVFFFGIAKGQEKHFCHRPDLTIFISPYLIVSSYDTFD
jgi:hypothetical protein